MSVSVRPAGLCRADYLIRNAQVLSIAGFAVICLVSFSFGSPYFLSGGNLFNLVRQSAPLLIVAVAMTFVITTGGIDLSVGSTVALVNALAAIALQAGIAWPLVVIAMLAAGALVGAVQGWFAAYQGIPSFIVTLAFLTGLRGFALLLTRGYSIPIKPGSGFDVLGRGSLGPLPVPALLAVAAAFVGFIVLNSTTYGRHVTAVGANLEAARRAGIPARRIGASVFVLTGVAAALAGLITAARLGSGSSNAAVGFELQVIAAVVLGGTSLFGGTGTIVGTVLGTLTIAMIGNGLILMHVSPFFTEIATGAIILGAIWLNASVFARLTGPGRRR
jgi:simple sugar transport system permease protein